MNPLSPLTYYRRHKGHTALLLSLISLVTTALVLVGALSAAIFVQPVRSNSMLLSRFSVVWSGPGGLDPAMMARVRTDADVERVILAKSIQVALPDIMGGGANWFHILALLEEDMPYFLERCNATLKEGQLVQPGTNGIVLSEQVAAILDLQVGDTFYNSANPERYGNILAPLKVVGVLESDIRLVIASYEYMSKHERYAAFSDVGLIAARAGREQTVDEFLGVAAQMAGVPISTFRELAERMVNEHLAIYSLLVPIAVVVVVVITLVVGVVNLIALSRRLSEFGLLHAIGRDKGRLTHRLTLESAVLALAGWATGVGLAWLALYALKVAVFAPHGYDLDVITWSPALLAVLYALGYGRVRLVWRTIRETAFTTSAAWALGVLLCLGTRCPALPGWAVVHAL